MKQLLLLFVLTFVCCTPPPEKINGVLVEYISDQEFRLHFPHAINDKILSERDSINGVTYIGWVDGDVLKEENDTIVANQLDVKKVCSAISNKARIWYFQNF